MWVQGGPPTSYKYGYKSTYRGYNPSYPIIRPFIRVRTPFITSRGPPCMSDVLGELFVLNFISSTSLGIVTDR